MHPKESPSGPDRLGRLLTDLGERSDYDAASQCSRCGYCEQSCPTYVATGKEAFSPRGRNQLVRLLLEGKIKDEKAAVEALDTCLLCSACTTTCYARVPTADLVLEGRRRLRERPHWLAARLCRLLVDHPRALERLLKLAYLAKRLGFSAIARPLLRRTGLRGLAEADAHVDEVPFSFLSERLKASSAPGRMTRAKWLYFAPCGPNYLFPQVGLATTSALEKRRGPGAFLDNGCCGLLAYNYGTLEDARTLARRVIEKAEEAEAPVVADCSSCAAFLKSYPQLFLREPEWRQRAERFAARVQDAVEALDVEVESGEAVTYHESCRACHGQGVRAPKELLGSCAGYRPLAESDVCCGGAGAYAFAQPELSDEVLRRKISRIAESGAKVVLTSSTSCLIQLARGLKNYYPSGTVRHVSEFIDEKLPRGNP